MTEQDVKAEKLRINGKKHKLKTDCECGKNSFKKRPRYSVCSECRKVRYNAIS